MSVGIGSCVRVPTACGLGLLLLLIASGARATDFEAIWKNNDPTETATWVKLCDRAACSRAVAVDCAPGATCTTRFPDPPAAREMFVIVSADGATWSVPSGVVDSTACLLSPACRIDGDRSGSVTVLDFSRFFGLLGTRWR